MSVMALLDGRQHNLATALLLIFAVVATMGKQLKVNQVAIFKQRLSAVIAIQPMPGLLHVSIIVVLLDNVAVVTMG
jgi:uncharacterized membrane protein